MASPYSPSQYDPATATWAAGYVAPATAAVHGTPPDYAALARSSPIFTSWKTGSDLAVVNAGAKRRAAAQALALNYGGLPQGFQDQFGDIDPSVLAQAQANPQSTIHRLQANYDAAGQQMQQSLAARGALHSGDLVQGQQNLDTGFAANQADAASAFGQAFSDPTTGGGVYGTYGGDVANALSGEGAALGQAQTALENDPTLQPQDTTATLIPDWQAQYGRPMYQTPDGSWYTPDPATGELKLYSSPSSTDPTGRTYTGV